MSEQGGWMPREQWDALVHCHIKPRYYGDPAPGKPIHPDERTLLLSAEEYAQRVGTIRRALERART